MIRPAHVFAVLAVVAPTVMLACVLAPNPECPDATLSSALEKAGSNGSACAPLLEPRGGGVLVGLVEDDAGLSMPPDQGELDAGDGGGS